MTDSAVMADITAALARKYAMGSDQLRAENVAKCVSFDLGRPESYQCWVDIAALALMMAQRLYVPPAPAPIALPEPVPPTQADWLAPPQQPLPPDYAADVLADDRTRPALFGYTD